MTNEENKIRELISRAKDGDQQAFTDIYESYYGYAYRATGDIIMDQVEREDVVQEAFTRIFTKIQKGEDVQNFGGLIATTAKNIAKDHIKAREAEKRPKEVLSSFGTNDSEADEENLELFDAERSEVQKELERASEFYQTPEELFEEQEVSDIIQEILAELPDYQQEALSLFYLEGMKQKEIADLYGVSVDTVKSRINQGKKKVEAKVIEIEKKKGIKLHTFAPLPFFLFLLRQKAVAEAAAVPAYTVSTGVAASGASKGIFGAIKNLFSKSIKIAGKEISTKVVTGVVVATVGVGSAGVVHHNMAVDEVYTKILNLTEKGQYEELCEYMSDVGLDYMDEECSKGGPRVMRGHAVLKRSISKKGSTYDVFTAAKDVRILKDEDDNRLDEPVEYMILICGSKTQASIYVSDVKLKPGIWTYVYNDVSEQTVGTIVSEQIMDNGMYFYVVVPEKGYTCYTVEMKLAEDEEKDAPEVVEEQEAAEDNYTVDTPSFVEVTDGIYHQYWEEHRAELEAEGMYEADGTSLYISWNDIADADGYDVRVEWLLGDSVDHIVAISADRLNNGELKMTAHSYDPENMLRDGLRDDVMAKNGDSLVRAKFTDFFTTKNTEVYLVGEGSDYSRGTVRIKAYRLVDGKQVWSEETVYN